MLAQPFAHQQHLALGISSRDFREDGSIGHPNSGQGMQRQILANHPFSWGTDAASSNWMEQGGRQSAKGRPQLVVLGFPPT
jgi:hypothetical protein